MPTCRTKAEDDNERAAPITIASSILLIFTCISVKPATVRKMINSRKIIFFE